MADIKVRTINGRRIETEANLAGGHTIWIWPTSGRGLLAYREVNHEGAIEQAIAEMLADLDTQAAERPVFTHPDDCGKFCTGAECTAVQFMCPRCGCHGFGDHCAETTDGAPVALCFHCRGWVTGRFTEEV